MPPGQPSTVEAETVDGETAHQRRVHEAEFRGTAGGDGR